MSRLGAAVLTGLAGYGAVMAAAGVGLLIAPSNRDATVDPIIVAEPVDQSTSQPQAHRSLVAVVPQPPAARVSGRSTRASAAGSPGASGSVSDAVPASQGPAQVNAFAPVHLVLPAGQQAPVVPVGLLPDGSLVIPTNPLVVGYWTGGALPGEHFGSIVIAGHVDSAKLGLGVLSTLKKVQVGQVIQLAGAAGQLTRYRVGQIHTVTQQSLATDDQYFSQDGPSRLIVITCGGPFDPVRHRYQDNVVVVAAPLP